MQTIKLNNGIECPVIGLGTFMLSPEDARNNTREALKMGCRLIDTANAVDETLERLGVDYERPDPSPTCSPQKPAA